jgi:hypothetical protein
LSSPSLDGGFDELREEAASRRSSSVSCSTSQACNCVIIRSCAATNCS